MTTLPTLTNYSGAIPNKATMSKDEFANAVHPYLNWWNDYIPTLENWSQSMMTLSGELQTLANDTQTAKNEAVSAKDIAVQAKNDTLVLKNETQDIVDGFQAQLPDGTINDGMISDANTWSSEKINEELQNTGSFESIVSKNSITDIVYDTDNNITEIIYNTGNKILYTYTNSLVTKEEWTDTDGTTIKVRITYTYKIITIDNFDYIQLDKTIREEL